MKILLTAGVILALLVTMAGVGFALSYILPVGPASFLCALIGIGLGYIAGMVVSDIWGWI